MNKTACYVGMIFIGLSGSAYAAETESPRDPPAETAPQSGASTTVKAPAGVTFPDAAAQTAGKPSCRSASAEMTNGATDTCKK